MQAHTVERVESWHSRPFSGGFHELHELADADFSGAVVAGGTWLFMLNGRVIGVFEGQIDDFEDTDGTVYEAPDPALALLFSMQERGGETQAKYYTNDTALSEADRTLSDANFTGYIELSENVLSGDYYVVYYGGRSMSAAFVGASEELITGDDAFERADDEVGLYEVLKTPVNVTSIPDVEEDTGDAAAAAEEPADAADDTAEETTVESPATPGGVDDERQSTEDAESTTDAEEATAEAAETGPGSVDESASEPSDAPEPGSPSTVDDGSGATDEPEEAAPNGGATAASAAAADEEGVFDEEKEWRNARSVPTLDPEKSETADEDAGGEATEQTAKRQQKQRRAKRSRQSSSSGKRRSNVEKLKRAVQQRDAKLEEAAERIDSLEGERDKLRERVRSLQEERDELAARADALESELEAAESAGATGGTPGQNDLSPEAALSGTNLFVRYDSKGKSTLDELGDGIDADAVNQNMRVDHHTQFEASTATVDGEEFETFLTGTGAYRFVSWAVRELPYEIRDAGHSTGLADLYDAIPRVDRAELDGAVEVETEDGSVSRSFDVVLRDRMGEPLVVAELNAEREPVTGDEMQALVDATTAVSEGADDLSAAMYVTASFFEPQALETAAEETGGGGFLSRSDKESYVKVGRKDGYHLCLVEDRNDAFHLTVPEL
ncbi:DUF7527 domain-containing protein [Halobacterium wangiae]|uniref:DUF7527 domain-containing protein n=1 Tax=Halobacterium wangiae TaxID=2902623 RepID=UPI001E57DE65|nr:hypothetical protein [Halobacterium wangiae]